MADRVVAVVPPAGVGQMHQPETSAATLQAALSNVRAIAAPTGGAIVQRLTGVVPDGNSVNSAVDASLKG